MSKFLDYINEATTGIDAWVKYFKGNDVDTRLKKDTNVYNSEGNLLPDTLNKDQLIKIPSSSMPIKKKNKLIISVIYNNKPIYVLFSNIKKPATKGGEQLSIPASKLIQTANSEIVNIGGKEFKASVFTSSNELSKTIINGISNIKTIPEDLKEILNSYLSKGNYGIINWMGYDNTQLINEVAKYLGELMIGLIVLNGESISRPLNQKMKNFIVPLDSSFAGVDSMFTTAKEEVIPISSKSGKGASASFYANIMPVLAKKDNLKITDPLLKYMTDVFKKTNLKNLEWIYYVSFNYLLKPYLQKDNMGRKILQNPYNIYTNIMKNDIKEEVYYLMDVIKNGKWPIMKNHKKIVDKLPDSLTYFLCQNLAELLNQSKSALDTVLEALGQKNFYQANLDQKAFYKGRVVFKILHSGSNDIKINQGKGSMNSVKSEQGRLTYTIY